MIKLTCFVIVAIIHYNLTFGMSNSTKKLACIILPSSHTPLSSWLFYLHTIGYTCFCGGVTHEIYTGTDDGLSLWR